MPEGRLQKTRDSMHCDECKFPKGTLYYGARNAWYLNAATGQPKLEKCRKCGGSGVLAFPHEKKLDG